MCKTCGGDQQEKEKLKENAKYQEETKNIKSETSVEIKEPKCDAKAGGDEKPCDAKKCKSRELRMGVTYLTCDCIKKNGLQDQCPRTCCQGSKDCMEIIPKCCPSKFPARYMNMTHGIRKKVDINEKFSNYFYKF